MDNGQMERGSAEDLEERTLATLILCGIIGFNEHLQMGIIIHLARTLKMSIKDFLKLTPNLNDFIPHCEHVKKWLEDEGILNDK